MANRDWFAVRTDYVTGDYSTAELAEKYGIPVKTIRDRCTREGWVADRVTYREELVKITEGKIQEEQADRLIRLQEVGESLLDLLSDDIELEKKCRKGREAVSEADAKKVKDFTATYKNVSDIMMTVYSIPNVKEQLAIDKYEDQKKEKENAERDEGGVIILPEIVEVEHEEDHMETTAKAD